MAAQDPSEHGVVPAGQLSAGQTRRDLAHVPTPGHLTGVAGKQPFASGQSDVVFFAQRPSEQREGKERGQEKAAQDEAVSLHEPSLQRVQPDGQKDTVELEAVVALKRLMHELVLFTHAPPGHLRGVKPAQLFPSTALLQFQGLVSHCPLGQA